MDQADINRLRDACLDGTASDDERRRFSAIRQSLAARRAADREARRAEGRDRYFGHGASGDHHHAR